jgi:hypothetical protein
VVWPDEGRQLQPGPAVGRPEHGDLGAGVGDAADRVQELTLHERPPLDLETEPHEEGRHCVEVGDGDADVVETSHLSHGVHPPASSPLRTG